MASKTLNIGIMSRQDHIQRTIAIAKGDYQPQPNEPKIWFESIKPWYRL